MDTYYCKESQNRDSFTNHFSKVEFLVLSEFYK